MCYVMKMFDVGIGIFWYMYGCMDVFVKNEKYKNICDIDSEINKFVENFVMYCYDFIV